MLRRATKNKNNFNAEKILSPKYAKILVIIFSMVILISLLPIVPGSAATPISVSINQTETVGTNRLSTGFALDFDWRLWRDDSDLRQLGVEADFKMVRIFSNKIEPCSNWDDNTRTGTFNWANVDSLMQRIFQTGAQPIITLIFMGSNEIDLPRGMRTTSTGLPNPESFAAYCREWVRHFQQVGLPVKYYELVNEAWYYFYPNWNWSEAKN